MIRKLSTDLGGYDLCIIGGGPAGLTIASRLAYSGLNICVLESGNEGESVFADSLKAVESDGLTIKSESRERRLGGASSTWNGLSAPLDEIDFETRSASGWPISLDQLMPFLAEASHYRFPHPVEFGKASQPVADLGPWRVLAEKVFIGTKRPYRFASLRYLFERHGVDLICEATVTHLCSSGAHEGERMVVRAACKTRDHQTCHVDARAFVLAAGGIENPRILLNSATNSGSLGNDHDVVGRYFMNHPKGFVGRIRLARALPARSKFVFHDQDGRPRYTGLRLSPEYQRAHGLLNSYVGFEPSLGDSWRDRLDRRRLEIHGGGRLESYLRPRLGRRWEWMKPRPRALGLLWFTDMEPRPENRITLAAGKDALGNRLPLVQHRMGERERATIAALHQALIEDVRRLKVGEVEGTVDEVLRQVDRDASHHLGATRMGHDPATSVVDVNCQVHAVANLFVAGGSLFPTGGCANPTYTIVALALRLAEHLNQSLRLQAPHLEQASRLAGTRIGIIGAGERVGSDVVPAIESLGDNYTVSMICARIPGSVFGRVRRYDVKRLAGDARDAVSANRLIYLAVSPAHLEEVLESLPAAARSAEVFIDIPAPGSRRLHSMLAKFVNVHAREDYPFLPWIETLREVLAQTPARGSRGD